MLATKLQSPFAGHLNNIRIHIDRHEDIQSGLTNLIKWIKNLNPNLICRSFGQFANN